VAEKLKEFGCDEIVTGLGRTGVVGVIKGKTNTPGETLGMRADMDALPIQEMTGKDYASPSMAARCMPAAMTDIPRCCSARRNISPRRAISPARWW
jgi:metal-dependent amidase/aminoacylase/carboxypeptidase family protein